MAYGENPYAASRNIHGRWGRVYRNGVWIANATEVSYTTEIDRLEVRRAGTRWVDYKEGEYSGSGSITVDYVHSDFTKEFINYINGKLPDGSGAAIGRPMYEWTLQVSLEDASIPGISFKADGSAKAGHEAVTLQRVKFWSLPGGYGSGDMVTRDLEFTFTGLTIDEDIVDPPTTQNGPANPGNGAI